MKMMKKMPKGMKPPKEMPKGMMKKPKSKKK